MALIGKIRRNFWFVLILLGLALAAFILMDMTGAANMGGAGSLQLGKIGGEKIDMREFQTAESAYFGGSNRNAYETKKTVWDFFVEKALVNKQADALGLNISDEELNELQFGASPSPIIQQNWRNPQTGQLDVANLNQIKAQIENGEEINPRLVQFWKEQKKQIVKRGLQDKISNMVSKAVYTPVWMAEMAHKEDNDKVDFMYVKVPFESVTDDKVSLSDADYANYLKANAYEYESENETRTIDYIEFDVIPTADDSMDLKAKINEMRAAFGTAENDSIYAVNNGGNLSNFYFKLGDLPEKAQSAIANTNVGGVIEPFIEGVNYQLIKVLDKRVVADSVKASHILRNADRNNPTALAGAKAYIDSLESRFKRGIESFDSLAIKNSQDPGSGAKGGDLGTFTQGRMVPEFDEVCFFGGKEGGVYQAVSQFGVHLIRVEKLKYNSRDSKYKVATASLPIVPSENTQNDMFDKVSDLVSDHRDITSLKAAISKEGYEVKTSTAVGANDFKMDELKEGQVTRDIVRWAFDDVSEVGDVAPDVYTFTDDVNFYNNKYLIASLSEVIPAGLPSVNSVKNDLRFAVLNQKKGEYLKSQIKATSLADVASQYSVAVDTAKNVSFKGEFVPGLGNEAEIVAKAFKMENMSVSKPVIGKSGVFVIQPMSKQEAGPSANIGLVKNNVSTATKSQVSFKLLETLKKNTKIEDKRNTFF